jgi:hypothetical protein
MPNRDLLYLLLYFIGTKILITVIVIIIVIIIIAYFKCIGDGSYSINLRCPDAFAFLGGFNCVPDASLN